MNINKITIISLFALLAACATSPTGRKQLILVGDEQMNKMGISSFQQMKTSQKVNNGTKTNQYVNCVANSIIKALPEKWSDGEWEVVVFEDETANAFALPGGKIGVHTGLLKVAENADQLAAVLGHEVGHVLARHGAERVSQQVATQTGMQLADVVVKQKVSGSKEQQLLMAGLGLGAKFGVLLPYSRTHESEADLIGLELMARAGFNPEQSVNLWQNMAKAAGNNRQPQFMSTHPHPENRIKQLQANMNQAKQIRQNSPYQPKCYR